MLSAGLTIVWPELGVLVGLRRLRFRPTWTEPLWHLLERDFNNRGGKWPRGESHECVFSSFRRVDEASGIAWRGRTDGRSPRPGHHLLTFSPKSQWQVCPARRQVLAEPPEGPPVAGSRLLAAGCRPPVCTCRSESSSPQRNAANATGGC